MSDSVYPGDFDSFTNPGATDMLNGATVRHSTMHSQANDAIEAIQSTLGVNPQGSAADVAARLAAAEQTANSAATATATHTLASGSSTVDLNTITTPGTYYQNSSSGPTLALNYPVQPFAGSIEVLSNGASMTMQRATYYDARSVVSHGVWYRTCYSGAWSPWTKDRDETFLASAVDFNTLTTPGAYLVSVAATSGANSPSTVYGHLEVQTGTNTSPQSYVLQRYTEGNNAVPGWATYERLMTQNSAGSSWSAWKRVLTAGAGVPGGAGLVGTGSPYGKVTPTSAGITYTDTAGTCGAWKWLSTGTTSTSWIVELGDTGWCDATSSLYGAGANFEKSSSNGFCVIRRVGNLVSIGMNVNVLTSGNYYLISPGIPGFTTDYSHQTLLEPGVMRVATTANSGLPATPAEYYVGAGSSLRTTGAIPFPGTVMLTAQWETSAPWPTTLPS